MKSDHLTQTIHRFSVILFVFKIVLNVNKRAQQHKGWNQELGQMAKPFLINLTTWNI